MTKPYAPLTDSLAGKVCQYFRDNPDEELSAADIAMKWDVERHSISALLTAPVAHKLLTRSTTKSVPIYCAGPNLMTCAPSGAHEPQQRRPRACLPPLDITPFTVVRKPPPPKRAGVITTDWPALFVQMKADGDAIEGLPATYYGSAAKAAQAWAKANNCKLELRKAGDTFGLYRTA